MSFWPRKFIVSITKHALWDRNNSYMALFFFKDQTSVQKPKVAYIHAFINIYILVNMDFEHEPSD